jgi:hypothetical protein
MYFRRNRKPTAQVWIITRLYNAFGAMADILKRYGLNESTGTYDSDVY